MTLGKLFTYMCPPMGSMAWEMEMITPLMLHWRTTASLPLLCRYTAVDTYDCGTPPMPKPTMPLRISIHM